MSLARCTSCKEIMSHLDFDQHTCTTNHNVDGCFDSLWASINDTHQRWDHGDIDNDTARARCDRAIADYLGT